MTRLEAIVADLARRVSTLETHAGTLTAAHNKVAAENAHLVNLVGATKARLDRAEAELRRRLAIGPTFHPDQPASWGPVDQPLVMARPTIAPPPGAKRDGGAMPVSRRQPDSHGGNLKAQDVVDAEYSLAAED